MAIQIAGREIGPVNPTYTIAEIGSNHDGSLERAKEVVSLAAGAGADAVKFQSFTADGLVARRVPGEAGGLIDNNVHPIIERLALPADWHKPLQEHARAEGVDFISAPFDLGRLELLLELDVPALKIASGDLTYKDLLERAADSGKLILLSTGMAKLGEIERSVELIKGRQGEAKLVLLHCVTSYPTAKEHANLRMITTLAERFGLPVGLSDHTQSPLAPVAAVALGACVVERHFTPDRTLEGPDHPFAIEPEEFAEMVRAIKETELLLGSGDEVLSPPERAERLVGRRSLCTAVALEEGEVVTAEKLKSVRPGGGIDPFEIDEVVGKKTLRALEADQPIALDDLC